MGNGYRIIKKLGGGAFGNVYLIEKNGKQYALKQAKDIMTDEDIQQCRNIVNVLSKINNEHIIKYYDIYMENNKLNILMELGGDYNLMQFIQNYKNKGELIEENIIRDIIMQLCIGIKAIHDNKIIHRDLSPDNIFIDKTNNKVKIGDFGISKILSTSNKYTKSQIGKFHYIADEIQKG